MGVRLRNSFYSLDNIQWTIDIVDTAYSSSVLAFETEPPGFQLKYVGSNKERYSPIIASECTVYGLVVDSDLEDLIDDMAEGDEGRFFLKLYKAGSLHWTGKMLADQARKQDQYYPYTLNINFTDGIGALKDIDFANSGTLYTGRESLIGIIAKILGKTGIADQFSGTDSFIKTCVHWYDDHHNFYAQWCPLKYTDVDHMAFYDFENDANKPRSCHKVMEEILLTFGCQIRQASGVFNIFQPNEYINNYMMTRTFYKDGSYKTYNYYEYYRTLSTNYAKLTGGIYKYLPPLQFVRRYYKYSQSPGGTSIIPLASSYDPAVNFLTDVSGGNGEYMTFSGIVNESFTLTEDNPPFKVKYRMDVVLTKADGTKNYLYNGVNGAGAYQWTTDSSKYVTIWSFCGLDPTQQYNGFFEINFTTPNISWDATGTFRFRKLGYYTLQNNPATIAGGISFSFTCEDFRMELIYQNQTASEGTITFRANNANTGDYSESLELGDSGIGDGPNLYSLGRLKASDGSTWINTSLWGIKSGAKDKKIHQLLVDEIIRGQQQAVEVIEATFKSSVYTGEKALVVGSDVYVPMSVMLAGSSDEWKGEWWKIKLATAGIQTGLWIEAGNYNASAEWYLQSWTTDNITEDEETNPGAIYQGNVSASEFPALLQQGQSVVDLMSIATTTEVISGGDTKISISVAAITDKLLTSGDYLKIINPGGQYESIQLNTAQSAGDTSITIVSHTFENDYPKGSKILITTYGLIKKINDVWLLAGGRWSDNGAWDDTEEWEDS